MLCCLSPRCLAAAGAAVLGVTVRRSTDGSTATDSAAGPPCLRPEEVLETQLVYVGDDLPHTRGWRPPIRVVEQPRRCRDRNANTGSLRSAAGMEQTGRWGPSLAPQPSALRLGIGGHPECFASLDDDLFQPRTADHPPAQGYSRVGPSNTPPAYTSCSAEVCSELMINAVLANISL